MRWCVTSVMLLLALCLCLAPLAHGQSLQELIVSKRSGVRLCGEKLIQSLMVVCDNKYNKRNYDHYDNESERWGDMWRTRPQALSILSRVRRGVVDECCSKSCNIRELSSYCLEAK